MGKLNMLSKCHSPLYPIFEVKRFLEALYSKGREVNGSRRHVSDAL